MGLTTENDRAKVYDPTVPLAERLALALRWLAERDALLAERERAIERAARRDFALDGFVEDWAWSASAELREEYLTAARDWLYGEYDR